MKIVTMFFLLFVFTVPAFAMDQNEYNLEMQRMQLEQARIQAQGMAMMGMGAALQNGINQGFQNMQQPRYSAPVVQPYIAPLPRAPINCISSTYGANMPSTTCY